MNKSLSIDEKDFIQNGKPVRLLSGAIHYFRVVPEYWRDRMLKMKEMGLNTLETYVAWNMHEPSPGIFNFSGGLDLAAFAKLAGELGLNVIVRPGPYICAEWSLGGLPAWLLRDPAMRLRCANPAYLAAVDRFLDALMAEIVPLMASRGGPIVALQVENEYGSFGNDKTYLRHLADGLRSRGGDCLLFTSDGPSDLMLSGGTLPDILKVANFGSRSVEAFAKLREHQPSGPLMCGEFWCGWFDHWGENEKHHTRDADDVARELDDMLSAGASVNFYMFHGGTNFGFMAGANFGANGLEADVTSYDYDSPLSEWGEPTAKFHACRAVIDKHFQLPPLNLPPPMPRKSFDKVRLDESAPLLEQVRRLAEPVAAAAPLTMEDLGQEAGFVLYRTTLQGPKESLDLNIQACHDRAQIFLDGECIATVDRGKESPAAKFALGEGEHTLEILVENIARINYGPRLTEHKGIIGGVSLGYQFHFDWTHFPLPMDNLERLDFSTQARTANGPAVFRGHFDVDEPADTFVDLNGWNKGAVWINGFNLGRFWQIGPQRRLYLPGPLLRKGRNELLVLELHNAPAGRMVELVDAPDLGKTSD